jgi:hypothetical protein
MTPAAQLKVTDPVVSQAIDWACFMAGTNWKPDEEADDMSRFRTKGAMVKRR